MNLHESATLYPLAPRSNDSLEVWNSKHVLARQMLLQDFSNGAETVQMQRPLATIGAPFACGRIGKFAGGLQGLVVRGV